jgi:hypothetical protein
MLILSSALPPPSLELEWAKPNKYGHLSPTISPKSLCAHGLHAPLLSPLMPTMHPCAYVAILPARAAEGCASAKCPVVDGVQYEGNEGKECIAVGPWRCAVNKGGCQRDTRHGKTISAYAGSESLCRCACRRCSWATGSTTKVRPWPPF